MKSDLDCGRRQFIRSGLLIGGGVLISGIGCGSRGEEQAVMITPNEDLSREHGVVERLLLIYEELQRRGKTGGAPMEQIAASSQIVRSFVQDYHERSEENYVFPEFVKASRLAPLTITLRNQHDAGRRIVDELLEIARPAAASGSDATGRLDTLLSQFVRMYRPHYAQEDTVLFPAFPGLVGARQYKEYGEEFDKHERTMFGDNGFANVVGQVEAIEKNLGINDLAQFTAPISKAAFESTPATPPPSR